MKTHRPSKQVSNLCVDLKTQLEAFDREPLIDPEIEAAKERRRALFKNLKEKLKNLSK